MATVADATPEGIASAEAYDAWYESGWGRYAFGIERSALERAGARCNGLVLDVGCGTARFTPTLGGWVVGVDVDPAMLVVAARRFGGPLLRADVHHLPFRAGAFDLAVAVTVCEFTEGQDGVVTEMARATRPGGRVVVGALNRRSPWGVARRHRLREPPWSTARFMRRPRLAALGAPLGRPRITSALFSARPIDSERIQRRDREDRKADLSRLRCVPGADGR